MKKFLMLILLVFASLEVFCGLPEGSFDWTTASRIAPGVRMHHFVLNDPRPLNIWAVQVDLSNPKVKLTTTRRDKDWGEPMPDYPSMLIETLRTRVGDFLLQSRKDGLDMRLAVNAAPWQPWTSPYNHKYAGNIGLAISDYDVIAVPKNRTVPAFIIRRNGKADMISFAPGDSTKGIRLAVSGFGFVLRNGQQSCDNNMRLEPRTFFGLSQDRTKLYFLIVDGRQKGFSEGFAYCEGAQFMLYLGAYDAINMDGGGSTTLVTWEKNQVRVVNCPAGTKPEHRENFSKYTRPVANSVGVSIRK